MGAWWRRSREQQMRDAIGQAAGQTIGQLGGRNPLSAKWGALAAFAMNTIRAGQRFHDTLGWFWPIVMDKLGNITINASSNHPSSFIFHDSANTGTDVLFGESGGAIQFRPNSASLVATNYWFLDRNNIGAAYGLYVTANGTSTALRSYTPSLDSAIWLGTHIVKTKAGVPVDADFPVAGDGMIVLDTTDLRLYVRSGGAWHYAALT